MYQATKLEPTEADFTKGAAPLLAIHPAVDRLACSPRLCPEVM
jgi:hypothetical protein